jgi:type I restriction enzyme R subunit
VDAHFKQWLSEQEKSGKKLTPERMKWLTMIKEHIATSLSIEIDDFDYTPFYEKGGAMKVYNLFGNELNVILTELNEALAVA